MRTPKVWRFVLPTVFLILHGLDLQADDETQPIVVPEQVETVEQADDDWIKEADWDENAWSSEDAPEWVRDIKASPPGKKRPWFRRKTGDEVTAKKSGKVGGKKAGGKSVAIAAPASSDQSVSNEEKPRTEQSPSPAAEVASSPAQFMPYEEGTPEGKEDYGRVENTGIAVAGFSGLPFISEKSEVVSEEEDVPQLTTSVPRREQSRDEELAAVFEPPSVPAPFRTDQTPEAWQLAEENAPPTPAGVEDYRVRLELRLLERYNNLPAHAGNVAKVSVVLSRPLEPSLDGSRIRAEFDQLVYDPWGRRIPALEQEYYVVVFGSGGVQQVRSDPSIRVGLDMENTFSEHMPAAPDPFRQIADDTPRHAAPRARMPDWWRPEFD